MTCDNQYKNLKNCTCTYNCSKKGNCCACISYHREKRELPGCFFSAKAEKTYNRSIDYFVKLYNNGEL